MADKIFGWFADQNRATLEQLIAEHKIKSVLEIGSFLGLSAVWFAQRVKAVTCIDTFEEKAVEPSDNNLVYTIANERIPNPFRHVFERNINEAGVAPKITIIQSPSVTAWQFVEDFDLVYIDGDHSYDGITSDILLYRGKAKKIICGDDYTERFPGILRATAELFPNHQSNGPFWWNVMKEEKGNPDSNREILSRLV